MISPWVASTSSPSLTYNSSKTPLDISSKVDGLRGDEKDRYRGYGRWIQQVVILRGIWLYCGYVYLFVGEKTFKKVYLVCAWAFSFFSIANPFRFISPIIDILFPVEPPSDSLVLLCSILRPRTSTCVTNFLDSPPPLSASTLFSLSLRPNAQPKKQRART